MPIVWILDVKYIYCYLIMIRYENNVNYGQEKKEKKKSFGLRKWFLLILNLLRIVLFKAVVCFIYWYRDNKEEEEEEENSATNPKRIKERGKVSLIVDK